MLVSKLTRKEFHRLIMNLKAVADELKQEKEEKQEEGAKNENSQHNH